jgi:hypothetical protein
MGDIESLLMLYYTCFHEIGPKIHILMIRIFSYKICNKERKPYFYILTFRPVDALH